MLGFGGIGEFSVGEYSVGSGDAASAVVSASAIVSAGLVGVRNLPSLLGASCSASARSLLATSFDVITSASAVALAGSTVAAGASSINGVAAVCETGAASKIEAGVISGFSLVVTAGVLVGTEAKVALGAASVLRAGSFSITSDPSPFLIGTQVVTVCSSLLLSLATPELGTAVIVSADAPLPMVISAVQSAAVTAAFGTVAKISQVSLLGTNIDAFSGPINIIVNTNPSIAGIAVASVAGFLIKEIDSFFTGADCNVFAGLISHDTSVRPLSAGVSALTGQASFAGVLNAPIFGAATFAVAGPTIVTGDVFAGFSVSPMQVLSGLLFATSTFALIGAKANSIAGAPASWEIDNFIGGSAVSALVGLTRFIGDAYPNLTGSPITASAGPTVHDVRSAIRGIYVLISTGSVKLKIDQLLLGTAARVGSGILLTPRSAPLVTPALKASAGAVALASASRLTGVNLTASAGQAVATAPQTIHGTAVSASVGDVIGRNSPLIAVAALTAASGAVVSDPRLTLAGLVAHARAGDIVPLNKAALITAAVQGVAGRLFSQISVPALIGALSTVQAGDVSIQPKALIQGFAVSALAGDTRGAPNPQPLGIVARAIAGSVVGQRNISQVLLGAAAQTFAGRVIVKIDMAVVHINGRPSSSVSFSGAGSKKTILGRGDATRIITS